MCCGGRRVLGILQPALLFGFFVDAAFGLPVLPSIGQTVVNKRSFPSLVRRETEALHKITSSALGKTALKRRCPWCHSSEQVSLELRRLANSCGSQLTLSNSGASSDGKHPGLEVVTIRRQATNNRVFLVFGEHSRELISVEAGLHLIRTLCGELPPSRDASSKRLAELAQNALQHSEFQIVVNANPLSRHHVEQGRFCVRGNTNGVDLNRNWDYHWDPRKEQLWGELLNPGSGPFSELESSTLKGLVSAYKPTMFLSVHSGALGMFMPWAYDKNQGLATEHRDAMLKVLSKVSGEFYRECPYGAAGKLIGYSSPGTSLDWVYSQLGTPYSFAVEIYTPGTDEKSLVQSEIEPGSNETYDMSVARAPSSGPGPRRNVYSNTQQTKDGSPEVGTALTAAASLVQRAALMDEAEVGSRDVEGSDEDTCFWRYNPESQHVYHATLERWTSIFLAMASEVAAEPANS